MESHEVVKHCLSRSSPAELAEKIGVSVSLIYKWSQPTDGLNSGAINPLDRARQLDEATGDHLVARWMAEKAGGFYLPNPEVHPEADRDYVTYMNQLVQTFADMLTAVTQSALDSRITRMEANDIRTRWERLKADTEAFVTACEQGRFGAQGLQAIQNHPLFSRRGA